MKKIMSILLATLLIFSLTGCGLVESLYTMDIEKTERFKFDGNNDCIAVYTKYTNKTDSTIVPVSCVMIDAFQNGVQLPPLVPSGQTNGYNQADCKVQSGATADIIWIYQLNDDSKVSFEISNGEKFTEE